jgi:hypothetical protein
MAGRTKSRALAFPIDQPAILMAMPSTDGAAGSIIAGSQNGFTQARQYCGSRVLRQGMELQMTGR